MDDQTRFLILILAKLDAIFRPLRAADWAAASASGALWEHRHACLTGKGIRFEVSGGSEATRKQTQRTIEALAESGQISLAGNSQKTRYIGLADGVENKLRALCDLPSEQEGFDLVLRIAKRGVLIEKTDAGFSAGEMVANELTLGNPPIESYANATGLDLTLIQRRAAPALCRGWVRSPSDIEGRTYYVLTESGEAALRAGRPELAADLPTPDETAANLYDNSAQEYREKLRRTKPTNPGEIGSLPLSACLELPQASRRRSRTKSRA